MIWLLAAGAGLSPRMDDRPAPAAILAMLVVNSAPGFVIEPRAETAMAALRRLTRRQTRVRRDGREIALDAGRLAPGDVVLLAAGDLAPADMRLPEAQNLQAGDSAPAAKDTRGVPRGAAPAGRASMVFRGTAVGLVAATGGATRTGGTAELGLRTGSGRPPLERRLVRPGRELGASIYRC